MENIAQILEARQLLACEVKKSCTHKILREPRLVKRNIQKQFNIKMSNEYFTPQGKVYKKQELTAQYMRNIRDIVSGRIASVEYTWNTVDFYSEKDKNNIKSIPWTFAQGVSFYHYLMATQYEDASIPQQSSKLDAEDQTSIYTDINYTSLPKTSSVNLLKMLSWDVIAFDKFVSHFSAVPELDTIGVTTQIETMSNTWGPLTFPQYASSSIFKNGIMFATLLGYGIVADKACIIYEYHCDGSELDVHTDPGKLQIKQQGTSLYWGKLFVDIESGDLVAGEMKEFIMALVTKSNQVGSVQKQRSVYVELIEEKDQVDNTPIQQSKDVKVVLPSVDKLESENHNIDLMAIYQQAIESSYYLETFIAETEEEYDHLSSTLRSMAKMGIQSIVGKTLDELAQIASNFTKLLKEMKEKGNEQTIDIFKKEYPPFKRILEQLVVYTQVVPDEATQFYDQDSEIIKALTTNLQIVREKILAFIEVLDILNHNFN